MMHNKSTKVTFSRSRAFTLIELLVVIAIISLLVSILLPSLEKAKALAKKVGCMSNLRNIGTAVGMYVSDSDGVLPGQKHPEGSDAAYAYSDWYDDPGVNWAKSLSEYITQPEIYLCTTAIPNDSAYYDSPSGNISYYLNGDTSWAKITDISSPSEIVQFWECGGQTTGWSRSYPNYYGSLVSDLGGVAGMMVWAQTYENEISIHIDGQEMLFIDSHVQHVIPDEVDDELFCDDLH